MAEEYREILQRRQEENAKKLIEDKNENNKTVDQDKTKNKGLNNAKNEANVEEKKKYLNMNA